MKEPREQLEVLMRDRATYIDIEDKLQRVRTSPRNLDTYELSEAELAMLQELIRHRLSSFDSTIELKIKEVREQAESDLEYASHCRRVLGLEDPQPSAPAEQPAATPEAANAVLADIKASLPTNSWEGEHEPFNPPKSEPLPIRW